MGVTEAQSSISADEAKALIHETDIPALMRWASGLRDAGYGTLITYSRKVFIPLTHLCRDSCHYCTFAQPPKRGEQHYMSPEQVLAVVSEGQKVGCTEALFTLGDKPELRYRQAQDALGRFGFDTTLEYLKSVSALVLKESTLLPHLNPGVMTAANLAALRPVAASMGLMLEELSGRLTARGGPHFGSPDKSPEVRLDTIRKAGELRIPFTTGLLVGIGETRLERIEALLILRDLHEQHGHLQEIIIQPFRAKPGTRMADHPDAPDEELLWTLAVARIIFGSRMSIQTPPNLASGLLDEVVDAGINDWGGVSPITADFVNPEAPWPHIATLAARMRARGRELVQRLPLYPDYISDLDCWVDDSLHSKVWSLCSSDLYARDGAWSPGQRAPLEPSHMSPRVAKEAPGHFDRIFARSESGAPLSEREIEWMFGARGAGFSEICEAADALRRKQSGDIVRYVVNRNINYTNVCSYRCAFCAFSKGKKSESERGRAYDLDAMEIQRRVSEAWQRGATEVCMQGGIHPDYTGSTYLAILDAVKRAQPQMHVHAFSPLEIRQGATTLGLPVAGFLSALRDAGLGSLPGTAAEILDDEVRAIICPDKVSTDEWLDVIETAHRVGLRTTATIMFGHVERPIHWARHLSRIRRLQEKTFGFIEFVPLPFVHMEAPVFFRGRARRGPTWRETVLMHAVARLALNPVLPNIQVSWVKLGVDGAKSCLQAGANDLGGTLMNESISRAAGGGHGEELPPDAMDTLIQSIDRRPEQRTTLYEPAPESQRRASYDGASLLPITLTQARKRANISLIQDCVQQSAG
jgi:FO synthase